MTAVDAVREVLALLFLLEDDEEDDDDDEEEEEETERLEAEAEPSAPSGVLPFFFSLLFSLCREEC